MGEGVGMNTRIRREIILFHRSFLSLLKRGVTIILYLTLLTPYNLLEHLTPPCAYFTLTL